MDQFIERSWIPILILHILLAVLFHYVREFTQLWIISSIAVGTIAVIRANDQNHEAGYWGAYLGLWDVMHRASPSAIYLPWEIGKFSLAYFMILGILITPYRKHYMWFPWLLIALLTPSALGNYSSYKDFEEFRQQFSFNVIGPIVMGLALTYFYRRFFRLRSLRSLLFFMLMPVVVLWLTLNLRMPDFSEISWKLEANFQASGGFGPNQVATMLSFGTMTLFLSYFLRLNVLRRPIIEYSLIAGFSFNSLLTFTRGGLLLNSIQLLLIYLQGVRVGLLRASRTLWTIIFLIPLLIGAFWVVDQITHGALEHRFLMGIEENTDIRYTSEEERVIKITSGRFEIIVSDLLMFIRNPLMGIGPGLSQRFRQEYNPLAPRVTAHAELTRLLAEHGVLGVVVLFFLVYIPWRFYRTIRNPYERILFTAFMSFAAFFFLHSAMRTGAIAISYALAFIQTEWPKFTLKRRAYRSHP